MTAWSMQEYMRRFDIVLLTETQVEHVPSDLLPGYSVAAVPASRQHRNGEGMLVAVRHSHLYHVTDFTSDDTALWVRLTFSNSAAPSLFVAVCYVPPQGSPKLQQVDLPSRMQTLCDAAGLAAPSPAVIAGDLNAHVSPLNVMGVHWCACVGRQD